MQRGGKIREESVVVGQAAALLSLCHHISITVHEKTKIPKEKRQKTKIKKDKTLLLYLPTTTTNQSLHTKHSCTGQKESLIL